MKDFIFSETNFFIKNFKELRFLLKKESTSSENNFHLYCIHNNSNKLVFEKSLQLFENQVESFLTNSEGIQIYKFHFPFIENIILHELEIH